MNKTQEDRKETLIELLVDPNALDADRDDAAMDLGEEFDDDPVLDTLIQIAGDPNEIDMILNSCGEAIGKIWVNRNVFDEKAYHALPRISRYGVYYIIRSRKPEWIEQYGLNDDKFLH